MSLKADIRKKYKGFELEVAFTSDCGTLALLGASGSGKSMTLKCIAGLISPDEGRIEADGRVLFDSAAKIDLKPQERNVGYLFQNYALFPNMTVRQNIGIAYRPDASGHGAGSKGSCGHGAGSTGRAVGSSGKAVGPAGKGASLTEKDAYISGLIAKYGLAGLEDKYPVQLSGGEQQRTALARIFAYKPQMLLLDEPFSALDAFLRENMQAELKQIIREYSRSVVLVTHSRDEAYKIADDLVILDKGRPAAAGTVRSVFARPGNARAARITGCKNISSIERIAEKRVFAKDWGIELETAEPVVDNHAFAGIRAHDFKPAERESAGPESSGLENPGPESAGRESPVQESPVPGSSAPAPNTLTIELIDEVEGPFEKDIIFRAETGAGRLWWITEKGMDTSGVRALSIAPEAIMLLEA